MSNNIKKKIIGQDDAIIKFLEQFREIGVGLKDPKPIGTFIFLGSTGSWKNTISKSTF